MMTNIDRFVQIKSNNLRPAKGRVLVSEPLMGDYYFGRSVIFLTEHSAKGSFGIILNKSVSTKFNEALPDFPKFDGQLYLGGPVDTNRLFFLHTIGSDISNSQEIIKGLYWGGNMGDIKEMISLNLLDSSKIRFFIGYSGWAAGQIESELKRNSWVVTRATTEILFNTEPEKLWDSLVKKLGKEYQHWGKLPVNPEWN